MILNDLILKVLCDIEICGKQFEKNEGILSKGKNYCGKKCYENSDEYKFLEEEKKLEKEKEELRIKFEKEKKIMMEYDPMEDF